MCIILDTNIMSEFRDPSNKTADVVRRWLRKQKGRVVYSPIEEWKVFMQDMIFEYDRAKLLTVVPSRDVYSEARRLMDDPAIELRSNDAHILALARLSGARILYSKDKRLHEDFKNPSIIRGGMVYTSRNHSRMLYNNPCD